MFTFANPSIGMTLGALWTTLVLWFRNVFPVRLVWLEAVGQLIGGGVPAVMALLFSMTTDATNEEERSGSVTTTSSEQCN